MLFYKVDIKLHGIEAEPGHSERSEQAIAIQMKTEMLFEEKSSAFHMAISSIMYRKQKAHLCCASHKDALTADMVDEYLKMIELEGSMVSIQEITIETYLKLLSGASRNNYIEDEDDVLEELGIAALNTRHGRNNINLSETILTGSGTRKGFLRQAEGLLCDSSLETEIERIFHFDFAPRISGHPVHYMIQSDDGQARDSILDILLNSLYLNDRLQSRRYAKVSFSGQEYFAERTIRALYNSCTGGTVVISFAEDDDYEDSEHARPGSEIISGLCTIMRQYRNKVLTVFCLRRKSEKISNMFMEQLGAVAIVSIRQETVFDDRAKRYLKALASEHGVSTDRALYRPIMAGRSYNSAELNLIFEEWFDKRLRTTVYAQYAGLETANKKVAAARPKGAAIDELERMIGLNSAKAVIHQALDFYKAQKLFSAKGFVSRRPAMHMVFTGNPGTAKTTVARLFAQIMKDNGLLSDGDLYEVGRADLVGKYVGWTAPLVKAKFKAAKGSVLFIDEAYSLVDDKAGLFGDEAINTIVQEMENCREDMVVIFAGYPDKMEEFLRRNPGLRSRIGFHVPFDDYSAEELYQITELLAGNQRVSLDASVRDKLLPVFEAAMKTGDFGNGRYARNLLERAVMKQASRLVSMDVDAVTEADIGQLTAGDFDAPEVTRQEQQRIGFSA